LRKVKQDIICCSVSGYGHTGPLKDRPAFDLVLQGISGEMSITGEPGRPPVRMGVPMGDLAGGLFGAIAISAALFQRERTGRGQKIDLSLLDGQISLMSYVAQYYLASGVVPQPIGSGHQSQAPYQAYRCQDTFITVACFTEKFWPIFCDVISRPELANDPRFAVTKIRIGYRDQLTEIVEEALASRTAEEWLARFDQAGVPAGPINTVDKALADPQVVARNMVVEMTDPFLGTFRSVGNPIKSTELDVTQVYSAPPRLGQHTREILRSIGYPEKQIDLLVAEAVVKAE
jgi:crotonobetainyl-CoA:carnitine CoA-transferase CaiB-like acyl-CoA transferase